MNSYSEKISTKIKYLQTIQHAIHHHFRGMGAKKEYHRWDSMDSANNENYCKNEANKWANWSKEHFEERDSYMSAARLLKEKF